MNTNLFRTLVAGLVTFLALGSFQPLTRSFAQQPANDVAIDNDDIGGVVTSPKGPEAGVWVIAETRDLPVRYIKSVVTDDRGRFVIPDLPAAIRPSSRSVGPGARSGTGRSDTPDVPPGPAGSP